MAMARDLGLTGPLGASVGAAGGESGNAFAQDLMRSLTQRSVEAWDIPRTLTALKWFARFKLATERLPFKCAFDDPEGCLWNRCTLDMFWEFIRRSEPMRKTLHGHVTADTAAASVSAIHSLRSREARYDIAPDVHNIVLPLAIKNSNYVQGPKGERKRSLGLRTQDLSRAARMGIDRASAQGVVDWAALLAGINLLLRGGELGIPDSQVLDPKRIISWGSIDWKNKQPESRMRPWLIVNVVPIKDTHAKAKGSPCPIGRRHDGPFGADPLCTYDAIALAWWTRVAPAGAFFPLDWDNTPAPNWWEHPQAARSGLAPEDTDPFFTQPDGSAFTTSYVRALCQRVAAMAGIAPAEVGAKCLRIGGSIDWREILGDHEGTRIIKQRGRWASDIGAIYQRPLLRSHLLPSMNLGFDSGVDLERICADYAMPRTL